MRVEVRVAEVSEIPILLGWWGHRPAHVIDGYVRGCLVVAWRATEPVGHVRFAIAPDMASSRLSDLWVKVACRRGGVATALLTEVERVLDARTTTRIEASVAVNNLPARRVFAQCGYVTQPGTRTVSYLRFDEGDEGTPAEGRVLDVVRFL